MTRQIQAIEFVGAKARQRARPLRHLPTADRDADRVLALVSAHDGVPAALLLHPTRCRASVARARQLAMYLMHTTLGRTMTDVGRYFGRDRTTVAHACIRIEDARDDFGFDSELCGIEQDLLEAGPALVRHGVDHAA